MKVGQCFTATSSSSNEVGTRVRTKVKSDFLGAKQFSVFFFNSRRKKNSETETSCRAGRSTMKAETTDRFVNNNNKKNRSDVLSRLEGSNKAGDGTMAVK